MKRPKQQQSRTFRFLSSKSVLAIGVIILVMITVTLSQEVYRMYTINQEIASFRKEIDQIEQKNNELSNLASYFKTDSFQEKEARKKLNLQKEGETAVAIPSAKPNNTDTDKIEKATKRESNGPDQATTSNPARWWNYFFQSK